MVVIRQKHKESAEEKEARLKQEAERAQGIQDQYQARGFELVTWVQDHKGLVSGLIAILVVAGAVFSGFLYYQKRSREAASAAYLEAVKPIEELEDKDEEKTAKIKKAISALAEVAKSQHGSGVGALANLYAGHLGLETENKKSALAFYEEAVKNINKTDILYPLALTGLAYAHEENGDLKSALTTFDSLADLATNPTKDLALYEGARLAMELKDNERAKKNVARLLEEYPASAYEKDAERLRDSLK